MTLEELEKELTTVSYDIDEVEDGLLKLEYTFEGFGVDIYLKYYSEKDGYEETDYEVYDDYEVYTFNEEIEDFIEENKEFIHDKLTTNITRFDSDYIINYINEGL